MAAPAFYTPSGDSFRINVNGFNCTVVIVYWAVIAEERRIGDPGVRTRPAITLCNSHDCLKPEILCVHKSNSCFTTDTPVRWQLDLPRASACFVALITEYVRVLSSPSYRALRDILMHSWRSYDPWTVYVLGNLYWFGLMLVFVQR